MRQRTRTPEKVMMFLIVLTIAVVAWSAPVDRAPRSTMPPQIQSLADLDRISIGFSLPLPDELHDVGLSEREILVACAEALTDAGFEIVADLDAPQWRFVAVLASDDDTPKHRGYALLATLDQSVRIQRLDHELMLPTYVDLVVGLNTRAELKRQVKTGFEKMATNLAKRVKLASSTKK